MSDDTAAGLSRKLWYLGMAEDGGGTIVAPRPGWVREIIRSPMARVQEVVIADIRVPDAAQLVRTPRLVLTGQTIRVRATGSGRIEIDIDEVSDEAIQAAFSPECAPRPLPRAPRATDLDTHTESRVSHVGIGNGCMSSQGIATFRVPPGPPRTVATGVLLRREGHGDHESTVVMVRAITGADWRREPNIAIELLPIDPELLKAVPNIALGSGQLRYLLALDPPIPADQPFEIELYNTGIYVQFVCAAVIYRESKPPRSSIEEIQW